MSFGSFIRGIVAQANPFDNGKTYGSYNPPKKKPEPGDPGYVAPTPQAPNPSQQANQNPLQTQRPENLFAGLNNNLKLPGAPANNIPVVHAPNITSVMPPKPGTVVQPNQTNHQQPITALSIANSNPNPIPRNPAFDMRNRQVTPPGPPSNVEIAARSAGAIGSNLAGGLLGVAKGIVQLPSAVLSAPKLVRLGAAKITGNKTAAQNIGNDNGNLSQLSNKYENLVKPVTRPLTTAETATDTAAHNLAPWAPNYVKPVTKALANLIPIDAAVSGVSGLSKARNAEKVVKEGEAASGAAGAVGSGTQEIGNLLTEAQLQDLTHPPTQIPVTQTGGGSVPIPVGVPRPGVPIREIGGDTPGQVRIPTPEEAATQRAVDQFNNQPTGRPDQNIEGVTTNPAKIFTTADKVEAQNVLDDKLATNQITKDEHKDLSNQLKKVPAADEPIPKGQKITVKQVDTIPVQDKTVVPQNLPEIPGTVRATVQTSPNDVKSQAVANAPIVAPPTALPKEVQAVLDNPKQFNKRQVAAARNQAKLAKKYAKTQEDIAAASSRADAAAPTPPTSAGFVPTGEFRQGANGNVSEVAHQSTEAAQGAVDTATLNSGDVIGKASQEIAQGGRVSPESVRNLQAMLDSGRFAQTSPEYRAMAKTLYGAGSDYGRGLSLFNPTMRRTASGDQLTNRFVSKLYGVVEDGSKLTDSHIAAVSQADNTFAAARDAANQALDRYNGTKSAQDFAAWKQARQVADDAEKHSLITEYRVANQVLKGNKDPVALKAVQDAEKKAGVYQMDWIDANMLSGTGTATRNFVNTGLVRLENRLFGGRGYSSKGAKLGNAVGNRSVVTDFKARNELDQNVLSKSVKQWSTTANTLGEGNINAVGSARAYKFYENQLKNQGVAGDQLARDTEVMLHTDPQGIVERYNQWSLSENALSGLAHSKKIEQALVDTIAGHGGGKLSQTSAKALVRLTVGFPTVIGRSLVGGAKRATFGVPDLISAGRQFAKGDTQAMKDALYAAKVHAGSGATLYALGTGLAEAGLISPSYPSDKAEQARWKEQGIQPNSIKIGGNWFSIPGYFGALALPFVIPANVINKTSPGDVAKGVISGIQDLAPTAGIQNFINGMEGSGGKQWVKNEITSLTRAVTPVGSLLNQIAKMTDSTKNDTTTKDGISNLIDSIASGIPGVNNAVNKIPATDDNGNILHNPNPVATFFGAQGADQPQGNQDVKQAQSAANDTYKQLNDYGVLKDKTLMGLVDKKIQAQIARGQDLTPEELAKVQKAVTKGVSDTGDDTAYLEKGQYDTNIAALKVKHDLLAADPTTKPSSLKDLDTAIKRGGVYKDNKIPYDLIDAYKSTSVGDWRKMGIPPGDKNYDPDAYDPEMYQKLWNMDQLMTKAGVSYRKDHLDKNKYTAEKAKDGNGRGDKQLDTSFGALKDSKFAPSVQQYLSIDTKSGAIPHISVQRPNIVHKISAGGGI